jgi:hypothetical protein
MKGTRVTRFAAIMVALCALAFAAAAPAAGNLARRAERLAPLELNAATGFSVKEYTLETGVYYRWRVVGDGREEYRLMAPQLFANSWIDRVSAEDMAVEPAGLNAVELDGEVEIDIWFVPIRPGDYRFYMHVR